MIDRQCPVCGKWYQADPKRLRWGRQTTCSRECSYQLRASQKQTAKQVQCSVCGSSFLRSNSQNKSKHGGAFCSRACHYAGRAQGSTKRIVETPYKITEQGRQAWREGGKKTAQTRIARGNYGHSEETKAKLSIATSRHLSQSNRYSSSKLENRVGAWLEQSGVVFVAQHVFRNPQGRFACVVDFYLPELNTVLEVNGTYWHADRRVYPEPINDMQRRCIEKYQRKLKLLEALGVRVVEVWEKDLRDNFDQAMRDAQLKIRSKP